MVRSMTWIEKFPPKLENTELNCVFPGKRREIQTILDTFRSLHFATLAVDLLNNPQKKDVGLQESRSLELRFV